MMVADYQSIAEVCLLAGGFLHARPLATRLVGVMEQAAQMLEPHNHYDFGKEGKDEVSGHGNE